MGGVSEIHALLSASNTRNSTPPIRQVPRVVTTEECNVNRPRESVSAVSRTTGPDTVTSGKITAIAGSGVETVVPPDWETRVSLAPQKDVLERRKQVAVSADWKKGQSCVAAKSRLGSPGVQLLAARTGARCRPVGL